MMERRIEVNIAVYKTLHTWLDPRLFRVENLGFGFCQSNEHQGRVRHNRSGFYPKK